MNLNWLKALLADPNGIPDDARVAALLLVIAFIINSTISVIMSTTHVFNAWEYGIGAGALAAGIGGLFGLRKEN